MVTLMKFCKLIKVPKNIEICLDADKKSGINYVSELIMKNRFNSNVFDELVVNVGGFDITARQVKYE